MRGVFGHEALALAVGQIAAFAAGAFCYQTPDAVDPGRVELDELHVLQWQLGPQYHRVAVARAGVRRGAGLVDAPASAGRNDGHIGAEPVDRPVLEAPGQQTVACAHDDIRDELRGRPYEIVSVAGGWSFRTKLGFGDAIRAALGGPQRTESSKSNALVLMAIGNSSRSPAGSCRSFWEEVSRDAIASLRGEGFIAAGPLDPDARRALRLRHHAGVPCAIRVRERRDLPDIEKLEDAGLLAGPAKRVWTATRWRPS